jgi:hypothetical protein
MINKILEYIEQYTKNWYINKENLFRLIDPLTKKQDMYKIGLLIIFALLFILLINMFTWIQINKIVKGYKKECNYKNKKERKNVSYLNNTDSIGLYTKMFLR